MFHPTQLMTCRARDGYARKVQVCHGHSSIPGMHFMPRVVYKGFAHSTQQQIRKVFGLRRAVPKANTTKVREEEYQKIIL